MAISLGGVQEGSFIASLCPFVLLSYTVLSRFSDKKKKKNKLSCNRLILLGKLERKEDQRGGCVEKGCNCDTKGKFCKIKHLAPHRGKSEEK